MKEMIGMVSGVVVIISIIPYALNTYHRKIRPNLTSWCLWSIVCCAILLTYKSSGAKESIWPAVFGFTNPTLIAVLAFWRGDRKPPNALEITCIAIGIMAIILWCFVHNDRRLSTWTLCLSIIADAVAAIPTAIGVWKEPWTDRPFPWVCFAFGYFLAMFAISETTFANYVLPIYMIVGSLTVATPLVLYRIKQRVPILQWI